MWTHQSQRYRLRISSCVCVCVCNNKSRVLNAILASQLIVRSFDNKRHVILSPVWALYTREIGWNSPPNSLRLNIPGDPRQKHVAATATAANLLTDAAGRRSAIEKTQSAAMTILYRVQSVTVSGISFAIFFFPRVPGEIGGIYRLGIFGVRQGEFRFRPWSSRCCAWLSCHNVWMTGENPMLFHIAKWRFCIFFFPHSGM